MLRERAADEYACMIWTIMLAILAICAASMTAMLLASLACLASRPFREWLLGPESPVNGLPGSTAAGTTRGRPERNGDTSAAARSVEAFAE